jgi:hypothetical protein
VVDGLPCPVRWQGYLVFDAVPLGFRNLTPAPPPFSSMNSMPAVSNARRTARS